MKRINNSASAVYLVFVLAAFLWSTPVAAQEYPALQNLESIKAVFDVRSGDPKNVFEHLYLLNETFKDHALRSVDSEPEFAVVFMDKSVTLLSKNRENFSAGEKEMLQKADQLMAAMTESGIILEVCLAAVDYYKVDASSIAENISRVPNGWISSIGYQTKGYSLVPVY